MKLSFHGAAQGVTGSCHLVQSGGKKILIDCGLYQGGREEEDKNDDDFGFDPAEIDFLLLTHAHLDHCGRIPLLVSRGFKGEIITTHATRELARLILLDSANLQEEEARYQKRKAIRRGDRQEFKPLYTVLDALNSLDYFGRPAQYQQPIPLAEGITATFYNAGHILGSASVLLELEDQGKKRSVFLSGDIGSEHQPLLHEPIVPPKADVVVMETTYGDRQHRGKEESIEELYSAIEQTFQRGGNVIIPTFALERAQELLFYLREGMAQNRLPHSIQVFLDSPMAISATQIFKRHPDCYDHDVKALFEQGIDPFDLPGLHFTRETAESMALNRINGGAVIMAGSGMCTGGRVTHHLKHNLWREDASVIFVGFAARETLARKIIDGAKKVKIFGEEIPVRAQIHTINGFSAHADQAELLAWQRGIEKVNTTYLVHGEPDAMQAFSRLLDNTEVVMPELGQGFDIK